jgi:hypothetical protein
LHGARLCFGVQFFDPATAGRAHLLQPNRHDDAVSMEIPAIDVYVAQIYSYGCILRSSGQPSFSNASAYCHRHRAFDGFAQAVGCDQHQIARGLNEPTAGRRNGWPGHTVHIAKPRYGCGIVQTEEPVVTDPARPVTIVLCRYRY